MELHKMQQRQGIRGWLLVAGILLNLWATELLAERPMNSLPSAARPTAPAARIVVPADYFVDDDNGGAEDGTAAHPFRTVQQAIDAAADKAVIAVAGGIYRQNIYVQGKSVRLYGGYIGGTAASYAAGTEGNFTTRDSAANQSHLKGDGKDSVVTLFDAGATVVDGFEVTGGGRSARATPAWLGGGFYVSQGSPTISNNLIERNETCPPVKQDEEKLGGGIYSTGASISINDNVIRYNTSGRGAGVAADGAKVVIRGNIVLNNVGVSDHGGGLYIFSPNAEISHNRIEGNEIGRAMGYGWGGGITVVNKGGNYKRSYNVFTRNFAPSVGSAIFVDEGAVASLDHELIYANACNPAGNGSVPAVYIDGNEDGTSSRVTVNHCTIADHKCAPAVNGNAITVTGHSKAIVKNSILWNNGGDDIDADATSQATVTYTLSQEALKGTGNLSKDPLFAISTDRNPAERNYRLRSTTGHWDPAKNNRKGAWVVDTEQSPAIDAADPALPFELEPAPNGHRANLGVYGNEEQASKSAR